MKHLGYLLLLFIATQTLAQEVCVLNGLVRECDTGEPLLGAVLFTDSSGIGTTTDLSGKFTLSISTEVRFINCHFVGFEKVRMELNQKNPCDTVLHICLKQVPIVFPMNPGFIPPTVTGFLENRPNVSTPASIGLIDQKKINSTDQTSLQNSVNTIPGVIMDQRGYGGSHRISIRGSALRAPFAVRNVKMYLEGIPLTSPDGQTPLEMIDVADVSRIEIIKGPAGSVWGSGNGGVIHLTGRHALPNQSILSSGVQVGSYDLYRNVNSVELGFDKGGIRVSHVYQDNRGYRVQEFNHKNQGSILLDYYPSSKHKLLFYATYFNGRWGLPGGLNATQADTLPTQAVEYSWKNNAHVWRERLMTGVSHRYRITTALNVTTALYYYSNDKVNPYGTSTGSNGYKDEGASGAGGRMTWNFNRYSEKISTLFQVNWGGEYQFEKYNIVESSLLNGGPGTFFYLYDVNYSSGSVFVSADAVWNNRIFINAGASLNKTSQLTDGYTSYGFRYDTTATWNSEILPRAALSYRIHRQLYAFASLSYGNANPTIFEMVDYENGLLNLSLRPEHGVSREVGFKYASANGSLKFEVNYYHFTLRDAIVSYQDTTLPDGFLEDDERFRYRNMGNTIQQGVEWSISKSWKLINRLQAEVWHTGSAFHYVFSDFMVNDIAFDGKNIPGVPLFNSSNGLSLNLLDKFGLDLIHYWTDRTPLDNDNGDWSAAYSLLNARIRFNTDRNKPLRLNLYGGLNNMTKSSYTSFYNLNAFGDKYFNPAPPANIFAGFNLSWQIGENPFPKRRP